MNPNKEVVGKLAKYKENGKDNKLKRFAVHFDRMLYTEKDDSESSGSCCDYDSWYQNRQVQKDQSYRYETMSSEDSRGEDFSSSDSEFGQIVHKQGTTDLEESDSDKFVQKINKMAKRYTASTSHTTSPIATTSSQTPSITPAPAQPTPNTAIADVSQLQVPQIICDVPKTSQVTSSPSQRKRKVYEESDEAKSNAQSQRISDDDGRENVHKTKRRKKRSSHSTSTERKSLKRKSYSNEIFALQKLDINNDADNIQDFNLNKKPKLDM